MLRLASYIFMLITLTTTCTGCIAGSVHRAFTTDTNELTLKGEYQKVANYYDEKIGIDNQNLTLNKVNPQDKYFSKKAVEANLDNIDYLNLALAYYKLKKIDRFFDIIAIVEDKISRGDKFAYNCTKEVAKQGLVLFDIGKIFNPDAISPIIFNFPPDYSVVPSYLKSLVFLETGEYQKAATSSAKILKLTDTDEFPSSCDKRHALLMRISAHSTLGLIHSIAGNKEQAMKELEALSKIESAGFDFFGVNRSLEIEKPMAESRIYMALGMYDKVLEVDHKLNSFYAASSALNLISGKIFAGGTVMASMIMPQNYRVTKSLLETGMVQEAKVKYDNLLDKDSLKSTGEIYWIMLFDRGRIAEKEGKTDEAIQYCIKAIDIIESQRSSIKSEAAKIGFVGDKQQVYNKLVSLYMSSKQYAKAFEYIERGKARALVDMLASKKDFVGKTTGKQEVVATLTELSQLETTMLESPKENETVAQLVEKRGTRSIQIREKLKQQDPEFSSLVTVDKVSVESIQKKLGSDTVLVEYHYLDPDLYIFTVTDKEIKGVIEKAPGLADKIMTFRKALQDVSSNDHQAMSSELYQKLISPVSADITKKKIVFVPHGALHYLPFGSLKGKDSYLVDTHAITYLPSASVLEFLRQRKTADPEILVLGNPDLNNPENDLKFAEQEAIAISGTFTKNKLLTRKMATKAAFKDNASKYPLIHIASHGVFNSESPLTSGLYLTPSGGDDGILSVSELYNTEINADLVTLSACETGMGKIVNGDDVVGLTRGFLYAGSSNIVASLWKVDDLATSDLMQSFYKNMKTMPKQVALQNAQQQIKAKYSHPFYWAAFELTGNGL